MLIWARQAIALMIGEVGNILFDEFGILLHCFCCEMGALGAKGNVLPCDDHSSEMIPLNP